MFLGIIQNPSLRSYFSTKRVIAAPGFGDIITRVRRELPCKFLHFLNSENQNTYQGPPKLFIIFPIISHISSKFQTPYFHYQNISIDETLTLWKGRLSFRQFFPLKFLQFDIRSFELCDPQTVVCANLYWEIYKN
jgi:hypothetical protein